MTRGFATDLLRRALGDLLAVVEDGDAVADAHDHLHVVLDEQDGQAQLGPQLVDERHHLGRLARVHPGGRLVEQQELGLAAERAGDLEPTLVAVRQVLGQVVAAAASGRPARAAPRPATRASRSSRRLRGVESSASSRFALSWECMPTRTFSSGGHVLEEADVLERPADAGDDHVVRPRAAEDARAGRAGAGTTAAGRRPIRNMITSVAMAMTPPTIADVLVVGAR